MDRPRHRVWLNSNLICFERTRRRQSGRWRLLLQRTSRLTNVIKFKKKYQVNRWTQLSNHQLFALKNADRGRGPTQKKSDEKENYFCFSCRHVTDMQVGSPNWSRWGGNEEAARRWPGGYQYELSSDCVCLLDDVVLVSLGVSSAQSFTSQQLDCQFSVLKATNLLQLHQQKYTK